VVIFTGQIRGFQTSRRPGPRTAAGWPSASPDAKSFPQCPCDPGRRRRGQAGELPRQRRRLDHRLVEDGKYLVFDTAQRSETSISSASTCATRARYREDEFRDFFKPPESPDRQDRRRREARQ